MHISIDTSADLSELDRKILAVLAAGEPAVNTGSDDEEKSNPAKKAAAKKAAPAKKAAAKKAAAKKEEPEEEEEETLRDKAISAVTDAAAAGYAGIAKAVLADYDVKRVTQLDDDDIETFLEALEEALEKACV